MCASWRRHLSALAATIMIAGAPAGIIASGTVHPGNSVAGLAGLAGPAGLGRPAGPAGPAGLGRPAGLACPAGTNWDVITNSCH